MPHGNRPPPDGKLHLRRQFQQPEEIGNRGTFLRHRRTQFLLGIVELVNEPPIGQRNLDGIQIFALQILLQRHEQHMPILFSRPHVDGNRLKPGQPGGTETAFTGDDAVTPVAGPADGDRLNQSQLPYGCGQRFQCILIKGVAGLVRIDIEQIEAHFLRTRCFRRMPRRRRSRGDQRLQSHPQSFLFCHVRVRIFCFFR